jgi:thiol:disulfide interchange protein
MKRGLEACIVAAGIVLVSLAMNSGDVVDLVMRLFAVACYMGIPLLVIKTAMAAAMRRKVN